MTIVVLLVAAAIGVAGLLYKWSARLDDASRAPVSVSYPMFPTSSSWTRVSENGSPRLSYAPDPHLVDPELEEMKDRIQLRPHTAERDDTATMRFVRPSELSVQLLPGRLEVLKGATPHREIRFLRAPGETPHVILGREVGVSPHYIGLGSPMVSRRHARLDFAHNRWTVKNLSRTNPVVVNDDELSDTEVARPLADGDRLELGDVVLRFHAQ